MGKRDLRGAIELWEEENKKLSKPLVRKKKNQFFFKWQRTTLWILFIFVCFFGLTAIGYGSQALVATLIVLGLFIKFLFWSAIGNAIYYSAQKKKKIMTKTPHIGVADEIRKFKALLDDGTITQEEFDKKKRDLLG